MPRLLVLGARQRPPRVRKRKEWSQYGEARLAELDTETGEVSVRLTWVTAPEHCAPSGASHVFKAGSWDGDQLLLCTQTEVLRVDPVAMSVTEHFSHPWFNDVHHVARFGGRIHVVSTGLDSLVVLDGPGEPAEIRHALGEDPLDRTA